MGATNQDIYESEDRTNRYVNNTHTVRRCFGSLSKMKLRVVENPIDNRRSASSNSNNSSCLNESDNDEEDEDEDDLELDLD